MLESGNIFYYLRLKIEPMPLFLVINKRKMALSSKKLEKNGLDSKIVP